MYSLISLTPRPGRTWVVMLAEWWERGSRCTYDSYQLVEHCIIVVSLTYTPSSLRCREVATPQDLSQPISEPSPHSVRIPSPHWLKQLA